MGKKGNKRKRYYKASSNKVARVLRKLDAGMKGFLLTCGNNREKDCVREAYSILNMQADKLYGPEKFTEADNSDSEDDADPDKAMEKEVAAMKKTSQQERRFQAVDSHGKNVIFIKTTLESPTELADSLLCDVVESKSCASRNICRFMPVIGTCKAHIDNIEKIAETVLAPFFKDTPHSYSVQVKIRNNSSLSRNDIIPAMGGVLKTMNCENRVDLMAPDYVISLDVITNICCISLMKKYNEYLKYNLQELTCKLNSTQEDGESKKKEEVPVNVIHESKGDNSDNVRDKNIDSNSVAEDKDNQDTNKNSADVEGKEKANSDKQNNVNDNGKVVNDTERVSEAVAGEEMKPGDAANEIVCN